jgi:hypothetical protein
VSELTPCNRCNLEAMKRRAKERGVEVVVKVVYNPKDPMRGWTSARYSDEEEPCAYFQVLTEACSC